MIGPFDTWCIQEDLSVPYDRKMRSGVGATAGVAEIDQAGCTREGRSPRDRGRTVRELFRRIGVFRHGRLVAYDGFTKR